MTSPVVRAPDAIKVFDAEFDAALSALALRDPLVGKGYHRAARIDLLRQRRTRKNLRLARRAALAITHFAAPLADARRLIRGTTRQLRTAEARLRRERRRLQRTLWWQEHRETVIRFFWFAVMTGCLMLAWSHRQEIGALVRDLFSDLFASASSHTGSKAHA